jgi:hypothetical protein
MTPPDPAHGAAETAGERARRIKRETAILAQAERDIDAGLGTEDDEMEAWLADLDSADPIDEAAPGPATRS